MLSVLRPCFTVPGFVTFCGLVAGLRAGCAAAAQNGGSGARVIRWIVCTP
jgi:hypothetical protein